MQRCNFHKSNATGFVSAGLLLMSLLLRLLLLLLSLLLPPAAGCCLLLPAEGDMRCLLRKRSCSSGKSFGRSERRQ